MAAKLCHYYPGIGGLDKIAELTPADRWALIKMTDSIDAQNILNMADAIRLAMGNSPEAWKAVVMKATGSESQANMVALNVDFANKTARL